MMICMGYLLFPIQQHDKQTEEKIPQEGRIAICLLYHFGSKEACGRIITLCSQNREHAMKCPFCGNNESRVKDSRDIGDAIHRRRECEQCKGRFSTYERVETFHLMVVKRDQRREAFDREKLYIGIRKACEKRPLPVGEIESAVEEIEQELYRQ